MLKLLGSYFSIETLEEESFSPLDLKLSASSSNITDFEKGLLTP